LRAIDRRLRDVAMRHSDVLIHLRAETNMIQSSSVMNTVLERSRYAGAVKVACLPADGTDKTAKLNGDRACEDWRVCTDRNIDGAVVREMTSG
jgi:hypothetical protein